MIESTPEVLFLRYRETGDPRALASVFDRYAPQLLLVAAHLAGGRVAEDLVQETFLAAIRHRERWDATRPLAPWLVGLLGNRAREARRQRNRVPDPRRIELHESERPDEVASANECAAAVHSAVERLPRHYRQVLSLRLVHGLELQQIAHSLDVPLGTVKVRLHRGVAMLRRALPAGLASALAVLLTPGNGLAAVRQVVVTQAGALVGSAVAAGGFLFGGWVMKQVVVAVAVVAVLVGAWFGLDAATSESAPVVASSAARPVAAALEPGGGQAQAGEATNLPAAQTDPVVVREAAPTTGAIDLQVVWASDGAPTAGEFEVWIYRCDRPERTADGSMRLRPLTKRASDAQGRVRFDDLAPGSYSFQAFRTRSVPSPDTSVVAGVVSQCKLAVEGDVRLAVLVVDEQSTPCAGAGVWCNDRNLGGDGMRCLGRTDRDGVCRYRGLPLDSVWARQAGRQPSLRHELPSWRVEDVPREEVGVKLVLGAAGCSLLGTVVDPRGLAVQAARVFVACDDAIGSAQQRMALLLMTDAAGRFACDEVPAGERSIVADAPGFAAAFARITTSRAEPATTTLALRVGATLSGRVTDDSGRPMAGVQVRAGLRAVTVGISTSWDSTRTSTTDAEGNYRIEAICPGIVRASAQVQPEAVRELQLADGQLATWDVSKEPERCIVGVVVGADDKPLQGWHLRLLGVLGGKDFRAREAMAHTDAAGRFRFAGLEDVAYRVFVFAPLPPGQDQWGAAGMVPRAVLDAVRPSPTELTVRIDAAAMASGWIEGSIAMPEGVQAKTELSLYAKVLSGGAFSVPQERLDAGVTTFRLGPLPAGEYDLLCDIEGRQRLAQRGLYLAPGATLRLPPFAVDAQRPLQLVLRRADGRPATGGDVKLRADMMRFRETSPGHYESHPVAAGQHEVLVRGPDFALCTFPLEFTGQTQPFERTVPAGTVVQLCVKPVTARDRWVAAMQVWLHDARGVEVVHEMIQIDGKQEFCWPIGLLPGTYSVKVNVFGEGGASTTFQVAAAPLRVDLQLAK